MSFNKDSKFLSASHLLCDEIRKVIIDTLLINPDDPLIIKSEFPSDSMITLKIHTLVCVLQIPRVSHPLAWQEFGCEARLNSEREGSPVKHHLLHFGGC